MSIFVKTRFKIFLLAWSMWKTVYHNVDNFD